MLGWIPLVLEKFTEILSFLGSFIFISIRLEIRFSCEQAIYLDFCYQEMSNVENALEENNERSTLKKTQPSVN